MHGAVLHVYNFRDMPQSFIRIGCDSLVGEYSVIRGQGGVQIGDRVYTSPFTQIIAVNHVFDDPNRPFVEQGITAQGIVIEEDVWLGAGAILSHLAFAKSPEAQLCEAAFRGVQDRLEEVMLNCGSGRPNSHRSRRNMKRS